MLPTLKDHPSIPCTFSFSLTIMLCWMLSQSSKTSSLCKKRTMTSKYTYRTLISSVAFLSKQQLSFISLFSIRISIFLSQFLMKFRRIYNRQESYIELIWFLSLLKNKTSFIILTQKS